MAKKFSIKKLLFVGMLSIAGLFGASSGVLLNANILDNENSIKEANASQAPTGFRYIYFTVTSSWNGGNAGLRDTNKGTYTHKYYYWTSESDKQSAAANTITQSEIFEELPGFYYAKILIPTSAVYIRFTNSSGVWWDAPTGAPQQTESLTLQQGKDLAILYTTNGIGVDQYCFWDNFENPTESDTLYFVPNSYWAYYDYGGKYLYPRLKIQFNSTSVFSNMTINEPHGCTNPNGKPASGSTPRIFYWKHIPITNTNVYIT